MPVEIRSSFDNPKLRYTLDYIFDERLGCGYSLNSQTINPGNPVISYGMDEASGIFIPDSGFMHPKGVSAQEFSVKHAADRTVLVFPDETSEDVPFDLFSAVFFMLSRYEEYTCQERDAHGRFDLQHSFAFKNGFHLRAVVDEWIILLRKRLEPLMDKMSFTADKPTFSLTVDVDMLFSYKTKGWFRNTAGWFRDLSTGRFRALWERPAVLLGLRKDPFDTFATIDKISREFHVDVLFFILASQQRTVYDKNGNLHHRKASAMLKKIAQESLIGLHPSYFCFDDDLKIAREKKILEKITGISITSARRHYLRMTLPRSYRQLVKAGFTHDYTMGFASGHGFRAGTSRAFRFFDLESDKVLPLTVHPFCIMDGSLKDYMHMDLKQSSEELIKLAGYIRSLNGHFEMLLHNDTLSGRGRWKGWTDLIRKTIRHFQYTEP